MAITTATISGPILPPGAASPFEVEVTIEATSDNGTLKTTDGTKVFAGSESWQAIDGDELVVSGLMDLPQADILPPEARWRATFRFLRVPHGQPVPKMAPIVFALAGNTTWGNLVDVSGVSATDSLLAAIIAARDETFAARDEAVAAAGGVDLSNYYNKAEVDGLVDAVEPDLTDYYDKTEVDGIASGLASDTHDHDDRYREVSKYPRVIMPWYPGDPDPFWITEAIARPAGIEMRFKVTDESEVPAWILTNDEVVIPQVSLLPNVRVAGAFLEVNANASDVSPVIPATTQTGDSIWTIGSSNAAFVNPGAWTLVGELVNTGGANSISVWSKIAAGTTGATSTDAGTAVFMDFTGSTAVAGVVIAWEGPVAASAPSTLERTADQATLDLPAITPAASSTIIGISGIRYASVGTEDIGARTGWTELVDGSSQKGAAPNRGINVTVLDAAGESGVPVAASSATSQNSILVQSSALVFAVTKV